MLSTTARPITKRFVLQERAGAGGMGTVYRALDTHTDQTVAVKLLQAADNPQAAERFAREAQLLCELRHPGIVEYLAHGVTDDGQPYLAMEWLTGEELAKRLARGALSLADSLTLLRRTASALAVAHQRGIVHRDLKPSNLFLRDGAVERVAILDFGIARRREFSHAITGTGGIVGTPAYMAPEQARGERDLTPAVDVFSLGCVLFECLSGRRPFVADRVVAVLAMIIFSEPPKLRAVRPDLPRAVEALLDRMLAKTPGERLPDATALLVALDELDEALSRPFVTTLETPVAIATLEEVSASIERVTDTEQHLVSVLVATSRPRSGELTASDAAPSPQIAETRGLARALEAYGAHVELLADGSLVATLVDARGAATDQAAQAARCALLIKARWPEAAIALCTGRGRLHERLPIGEVLDRAMRLLHDRAGAPASEQILLDHVTRGLLDVRFHLSRTASGAHTLLGEELTLDASRPLLGKPTPCVGREAELGMLELVLAGCIEDAAPRAMLVTAPPGAGKSRLRHEFLRRVEGRGDTVQILFGRGDPMTAGSAYGLLGQALRRLAGVLDGEDLELRRAKLARRMSERLPAADRERVVAFLGEVAGVAFPDEGDPRLRAARQDPQIMANQITSAMLDFLRAACAEHPLLLVLEDLHWGDALTVKLVATALRELGDRPLMVLGLARPEANELLLKPWAGLAQPLPLRPLSKKAGERLVHEVLGADRPKETVARIVEHAAGNALFLEELIRAEAEGQSGQAPETVLAILQARIGRLAASARRVLRAASVFGEISWVGGIHALLGAGGHDFDDALQRLTEEEILEERRDSQFPGEREVRFRHVLMRDAAYGLLTEDDRAEGHRAAAQYLEVRGEPAALVLAEHFLQGREPARAIPYYMQAAEQSYETNDMAAVLACAERGLRCGAQGAQRGAFLSLEGAVYLGREQYAEAVVAGTEAIELLPEGGKSWCRAFENLFPAAAMTRQVALFAELSSRFARVDPSADARGQYVRATAWLSAMLGITGEKVPARAFLTRARAVCAGLDRSEVAWAYLRAAEGSAHHVLEDAPWACMRSNAEGKRLLGMAGEQRTHAIVWTYYGKALHELGDRAAAEAELRNNLAATERLNEPFLLAYAKTYLARLLASSTTTSELEEGAQLARTTIAAKKNPALLSRAHGALAEIMRRRGDLSGAEAEARAACEAARSFPTNAWDLVALWMQILIEQGRAAEALPVGDDAVRELEHLGLAGSGELALRLAVAEAHHAVGDTAAAAAALTVAIERLWLRVHDIPEGLPRERYLTQVPVNARLISLGRAWLGEAAVTPPDPGLGNA
jgi:serine/threonine protein kinase